MGINQDRDIDTQQTVNTEILPFDIWDTILNMCLLKTNVWFVQFVQQGGTFFFNGMIPFVIVTFLEYDSIV